MHLLITRRMEMLYNNEINGSNDHLSFWYHCCYYLQPNPIVMVNDQTTTAFPITADESDNDSL